MKVKFYSLDGRYRRLVYEGDYLPQQGSWVELPAPLDADPHAVGKWFNAKVNRVTVRPTSNEAEVILGIALGLFDEPLK